MCCVLTVLLFFGPRITAIVWSLLDPLRWQVTFDTLIVPCLGLLFLPWTLLAYVFFAPGGVGGIEWVVVVIAFLADIGSLSGGAYGNRERIRRYRA
jgi:hypothetical protein